MGMRARGSPPGSILLGLMCPHRLRREQRCSPQKPLSRCPTLSLHRWLLRPLPCTPPASPAHHTPLPVLTPGTQAPSSPSCSHALLPPGPRPTPVCPAVEGTTVTPKGVLVLIPGTCEYVTSHGKWGYCADMVRSTILRWGESPGWAQCHPQGPQKREAGVSASGKELG